MLSIMSTFDRARATSCSPFVETMRLSCIPFSRYSEFTYSSKVANFSHPLHEGHACVRKDRFVKRYTSNSSAACEICCAISGHFSFVVELFLYEFIFHVSYI